MPKCIHVIDSLSLDFEFKSEISDFWYRFDFFFAPTCLLWRIYQAVASRRKKVESWKAKHISHFIHFFVDSILSSTFRATFVQHIDRTEMKQKTGIEYLSTFRFTFQKESNRDRAVWQTRALIEEWNNKTFFITNWKSMNDGVKTDRIHDWQTLKFICLNIVSA